MESKLEKCIEEVITLIEDRESIFYRTLKGKLLQLLTSKSHYLSKGEEKEVRWLDPIVVDGDVSLIKHYRSVGKYLEDSNNSFIAGSEVFEPSRSHSREIESECLKLMIEYISSRVEVWSTVREEAIRVASKELYEKFALMSFEELYLSKLDRFRAKLFNR